MDEFGGNVELWFLEKKKKKITMIEIRPLVAGIKQIK